MTENISEAFGKLIGLIQINGDDPSTARSKVLKEGYPKTEVDHLLKEHWDYEVDDDA